MQIRHDRPGRERSFLALVAVGLLLGLPGCSGPPKPREGCLRLNASPRLNLYSGQPHVVALYIFPLSSTQGFEQATVDDLLGGATPPGVESAAVHVTVRPGEEDRRFEDLFPANTLYLGVIANYYRSPGDPEGSRKLVVPAKCGWWSPELNLAPTSAYLE